LLNVELQEGSIVRKLNLGRCSGKFKKELSSPKIQKEPIRRKIDLFMSI